MVPALDSKDVLSVGRFDGASDGWIEMRSKGARLETRSGCVPASESLLRRLKKATIPPTPSKAIVPSRMMIYQFLFCFRSMSAFSSGTNSPLSLS